MKSKKKSFFFEDYDESEIIVDNVNCIKTSFPNFVTIMKDIGANFSKKN